MSERDVALYVEDMIEFTGLAMEYVGGLTEATLTAERMRYDAILRNIELIGEAATHVPDAVRALAPDVPWRQIVGARNRVAHGYLGISTETVWNISTSSCLPCGRPCVACWSDCRARQIDGDGSVALEGRDRC